MLYIPEIASSTFLLSFKMYIEVNRKNTPPIISTKLVTNNAYCSDLNCVSLSCD